MPVENLGIDREIRMETLEEVVTVSGSAAFGISSSGPWRSLVIAIVQNRRTYSLTPNQEVVRRCREKKALWDRVSPFIDKTSPAWKNFQPPTE